MPTTMYTLEEMTQILNNAIEDRAEWFWRLYTGYKAVDPKAAREVAERVIGEFGQRKGKKMELPDDADAREFVEGVMNGPARYSFAMTATKLDPDESSIKFAACPFMDVFKKLGLTEDEKKELCAIASCGDFGMASLFPHLTLDFPELISHGDSCCHMHITRKAK